MIIEISKPFRMYRSDTDMPPTNWDINHAYNTKYGTKFGERGPKNQAGLFFFHDHIDVSNSYGVASLREINKQKVLVDNQSEYYITEVKLADSIRIIDFSKCQSMFMMIDLLMIHGMNILNDNFTNHINDSKLSRFSSSYNKYNETKDSIYVSSIYLTKRGMEFDYSYFGQMLSDFENGIELKKIFEEKNIDGYRWREHNDPRGLTYCLLNSKKLQDPLVLKKEITL